MTMPFGAALAAIGVALQRLGIPWFVGGSVASLVHGEIRTTQDVDIVLDVQKHQVDALVAELTPEFFVDRVFVAEAVRTGTPCNVLHRTTGMKVDLFPLRTRAFSRAEMARRTKVPIFPGVESNVATAEDCLLTKLEWFEKGGRVSDRQWRDILGIVRLQGARLDRDHLRRWAPDLGVSELLERALLGQGKPPEA